MREIDLVWRRLPNMEYLYLVYLKSDPKCWEHIDIRTWNRNFKGLYWHLMGV